MKRSSFYLEHANITVKNLPEAIRFFETAFPEFKIRGRGEGNFGDWVHIGTPETYIALVQGPAEGKYLGKDYDEAGFNHLGFVVEDVEALAARMSAAGFERSYPKQLQRFRIRDYFLDGDGNEYEFVQYLSEVPEERNDYSE